jgi:eukaryotic-like serine/threonine-protein kinase
MMGSPLYMSPEQMQSSKTVDARTDIWALGVVLFELVAGRPPFVSDALPDLVLKIATEPPPTLRTFRPDLPQGLDAVILKCLEKDARQRYSNIGELALALLPFAPKRAKGSVERISGIIQSAGLSASALAVPASPKGGGTQVSSGTLPPVGRTTAGVSRGRSAAIGAGVFGVLAIAAGASFVLLHKKTPEPQDQPQAASSQVAASTVSSPSPSTPTTPTPTPTPTPIATPTPTATPITPATVTPPPAETTKKKAPAAPLAAPPPAKTNCSPPYFFDGAGHKQYKPECM